MRMQFNIGRLCGTTSVVAIAAAAMLGSAAQPARALDGIYGGGSSLVSLALRQAFDCYNGAILTNDGYSFSSSFATTPPSPGLLPTTCTSSPANVQGLYAAVGSGNGFRGFITNDPKQLFLGTPAPTVTLPATPPPYIDSAGSAGFNTYPYPHVDFGASDSPLSSSTATTFSLTTVSYSSFSPTTNWDVAGVTQAVSAAGTSTVTYATATFGAPIQLPLIAAPVAIAINVNDSGSATWTINSQLSSYVTSGDAPAGSAIQLTTAQVCAIFSGTVNDWSSTANIAYLDNSGTNNIGAVQHQLFSDANVGNGSGPAAYTSSSLPIVVAYRSDGSGTSYIMTNYLKNSCRQLDDGSNGYATIFNTGLPSTSFATLIANINTVKGVNVTAATYNGSHPWVGGNGTAAVAELINNQPDDGGSTVYAGRIGYVSADFSQPYQLTSNVSYTPVSASVQNEAQRVAGIYVPTSVSPGTFIAPTPATADLAFTGLTAPASTATYADWNLYAQTYTSGTLSGKSKLGNPDGTGAYPVAGTAFMALYSCYDTTARADRIKNFLTWFYGDSTQAAPVLQNNGFNPISASLRSAALTVAASIGGGNTGACAGKSGAL